MERTTKQYGTHVETMLSPALAIVAIATNCADWPDAVATAAAPPSRDAMRFSNTSWRWPQCGSNSTEARS
jgi:hypothetical protein